MAPDCAISETSNCPTCLEGKLISVAGLNAFCQNCGSVPSTRHVQETGSPTAKDESSSWTVKKNCEANSADKDEVDCESMIDAWRDFARPSDQTEANFVSCLAELTRLGLELSLPRTLLATASNLCERAFRKGLAKGRTIRLLSAAIIYITCLQDAQGLSLNEVAKVSDLQMSTLARLAGIVQSQLGLRIPEPKLSTYVPRVLNHLELSTQARDRILERTSMLVEIVENKAGWASGKHPLGIVCAMIYLVADGFCGVTQRKLADAVGLTETTVRNRLRELTALTSTAASFQECKSGGSPNN